MNINKTSNGTASWKSSLGLLFLLLANALAAAADLTGSAPFDENMSAYAKTAPSGVVADLERKLENGTVTLATNPTNGYLESLLHELNVPSSSQLLVASKTSPNKALISPKNPRALYFNESVYLAYVPGAPLIELAAADPKLGVVFYTLEQKTDKTPRFHRDNRCLECHASAKTMNVPGFLVRSFNTMADGEVDLLSGIMVDHRTPIADRWGGYYVTGTLGNQTHRGNIFATDAAHPAGESSAHRDVVDLSEFLSTSRYPEKGSDVVALMVLEHQIHMQNLLTRISCTATQSTDIHSAYPEIEAALQYLLFIDEAALHGPVQGTSGFQKTFTQYIPKDNTGRSLGEFNLQTRLFKYPCSYMIYSPAFAALPAPAKAHFYRRLWQILSGEDTSAAFQHLSADDRKSIREILLATKKDLPIYWRL